MDETMQRDDDCVNRVCSVWTDWTKYLDYFGHTEIATPLFSKHRCHDIYKHKNKVDSE